MDLTHRFSVPAGVAEAWDAFNDLEGLAPCFPGATITSVDGDEFSGSVKIKLGPISLMYNGSGRYVERNDADRRVVIEARAGQTRNGTATATVLPHSPRRCTDRRRSIDRPGDYREAADSVAGDLRRQRQAGLISSELCPGDSPIVPVPMVSVAAVLPEPSHRRARLERLPQLLRATRRTPSRPSSSRLCLPRKCRPRRSLRRRRLPSRPIRLRNPRARHSPRRRTLHHPSQIVVKAPSMCSAPWDRCC